jgi:3-phosphoshikimate 1-carboxyvinyltransferase
VPVLAATAALAQGRTIITGAARLRIKESDRLQAMTAGLSALGAHIQQQPDGLVIDGVPQLSPGTAQGENDHRIVMALAVAALRGSPPTVITDAQSVAKSYPDFFEEYNRLGGKANVI